MWTLALETTSNQGSLALLRDATVVESRPLAVREYSTELFPALKALLASHDLDLPGLDLFAVADGPGSFTGVRVGLTAVKGLIEVLRKPAVPISTLRAVAAAGGASTTATWAALDASRNEVYFGYYPNGADSADNDAIEGIEATAQFAARLATRPAPVFTPHPQLVAQLTGVTVVETPLAEAVGRLGYAASQRGIRQDALQLDARYLRRSDAELHWTRP